MYELPVFRDNPRAANIKGPVNKKALPGTSFKLVSSQTPINYQDTRIVRGLPERNHESQRLWQYLQKAFVELCFTSI